DAALWDKLGVKDVATNNGVTVGMETETKEVDGKKVTTIKSDFSIQINDQLIEFKATGDGANKKYTTLEEVLETLETKLNTVQGQEKTKVSYADGKIIIGGPQASAVKNGDGTLADSVRVSMGNNAIVSYNGVEVESETNNISVNGFNFTINSIVNDAITVVSTQDNDAIVEVVKNFVDEYNKLIEDIHTKLGAPSSKGFDPLTAEQKKDMSESEIQAWEKKIKDSLFRRDPDLKNITDSMRQILGGVVEGGVFGSLSEIGISTGDWKENGKLHFDEEKFKKALDKDTDGVVQLLAGSGDPKAIYEKENLGKKWEDLTDKDIITKYEQRTKGIMDRLYDHIKDTTKSTKIRSAYSFYNDKALDTNISEAKKEVTKLQERMTRMEDMYYKKFTAMEKMMSQLNNQSNWLMSQVGGM
ncbi:MAG: flagellar filament capping protein FliD, partial [Cellulosilyticaceae bacterium]